LQAAVAIGETVAADAQDLKACGVFSVSLIHKLYLLLSLTNTQKWAKYISPDGKRQDAAHAYIHPLVKSGNYPNLHLLVESKVTRVLFDEKKRAIGLEYTSTPSSQPVTSLSKPKTSRVLAKKLVVVSAGALGTPSILERSGVGSQDVLNNLGIPVISGLSDVGEHYQDHNLLLYTYKTTWNPEHTMDDLISGRKDVGEAILAGDPMLGWNAIDVASKIRPTEDEVAQLGLGFQKLWNKDFKDRPTRPLMLCGVLQSFLGDHKVLPQPEDSVSQQYCTIATWTAYPYSRGDIHITSTDVNTPASFNTGFFSHPADVKKQIWAYKKQREFFRRTNAYRGELDLGHPRFPEGSKAALCDSTASGFSSLAERKALPPIEYSAEDDEAIEHYLRENVNTTWHSLGTCRMAPLDQGGVVDADLNVYGVTNLKLCDLSICPGNVGANTNSIALMIGEKAADIIARDLDFGLSGDTTMQIY
jgi:alcohol oxidase